MGLLDDLKKKNEDKQAEIQKNEEDYISLIRVYIQAFVAETFGISNINQMPDLRAFKVACKVPTQNGKLGLGERGFLQDNQPLNHKELQESSAGQQFLCCFPGICTGFRTASHYTSRMEASDA